MKVDPVSYLAMFPKIREFRSCSNRTESQETMLKMLDSIESDSAGNILSIVNALVIKYREWKYQQVVLELASKKVRLLQSHF